MTFPEIILRVIEISIALYVSRRIYQWLRKNPIKLGVKFEPKAKSSKKLESLFHKKLPELAVGRRTMGLQLICNANEIAQQINNFPLNYHEGFFRVRTLSRKYLERGVRPNEDNIQNLAEQLRSVLIEYGAGIRGAPNPREESKIADLLKYDTSLRSDLAKIEGSILQFLNLGKNKRIILTGAQISDAGQFDQILLSVLNRLADGLFNGNTNVTYPMKALLLISGLMPAFDSNVKAGLKRTGLEGVAQNQFLLPAESATGPDMKKLTRLPFLLGQCWSNFSDRLKDGIRQSNHPELMEEPGRVFDILFFMQGKRENLQCLNFHPFGEGRWYELD